jgi:uncharacterized membrane protein YfcA
VFFAFQSWVAYHQYIRFDLRQARGVTTLLLLYPLLPMARIVASDIAHAVPLTLVAGIGHWAMGAIDWHLMGVLLMGSLPGILLGSYCAHRVPERRYGWCSLQR